MPRLKRSYKTGKSSRRARVTLDNTITCSPQGPCQCCGGEVEQVPMIPGVCYDCYRKIVSGEIQDPRKARNEGNAYSAMDVILGTEPATQREMESMVELFE